MTVLDSFGTRSRINIGGRDYTYYDINKLCGQLGVDAQALPVSIRLLLENMLRNEDGRNVSRSHIESLGKWSGGTEARSEVPFLPARVLMQDFTGVPAVVDLAAMRDALARLGGDPKKINPRIPVHLVIDHSVQVDRFGTRGSFEYNVEREMERNRERYTFLKWGQDNFGNFNVVPPATGICHQVNLEYLAKVVMSREENDETVLYPDTLVGLDSHTTMINGVGVLGWGVGGIEAEATMLGQPYYMLTPKVIGVRLTGRLGPGATATDLVLSITEMLRKKGVVETFLEFFGDGVEQLSVPDRSTISNMTPEFGATLSYFPVDQKTLEYLRFTGRSENDVAVAEAYLKAQGLFHMPGNATPRFTEVLELDLAKVESCLAGPRRPHDRIPLREMKAGFARDFQKRYAKEGGGVGTHRRWEEEGGAVIDPQEVKKRMVLRKPFDEKGVPVNRPYISFYLDHGSVVIAAITSCTNTSNPSVLMGAGLMAKKAVEAGLLVRPWVKASIAPGSKVVTDYLEAAGLMPYLEALRFHRVAYGCTTCIGNSGPLQSDVAQTVLDTNLIVASVLSGNRNYDGRINPLTRANYLASPMLVIAYALAGTVNIDMLNEPLAHNGNNEPVFLKDIWPTPLEIEEAMQYLMPDMFRKQYENVFEGDAFWKNLPTFQSERYLWQRDSTYIKEPTFFQYMGPKPPPLAPIHSARVLALLGDTITTDHISPAGAIPHDGPAANYLVEQGVSNEELNSYGARRGNHEVMMRGTFGNVRLRNKLAPDTEGGWTKYIPTGEILSIFDAARKYEEQCTPLLVIAGKEYGSGSSRDWAAKGPLLLGIRAVIAESFERIHRSNLVAMGILPLQFLPDQNAELLGITGEELFQVMGIRQELTPNQKLTVRAETEGNPPIEFSVISRLDSVIEIDYYKNGGILPFVLRQMLDS